MQAKHILINILIAIGGMLLIIYTFQSEAAMEKTEVLVNDTITSPKRFSRADSEYLINKI